MSGLINKVQCGCQRGWSTTEHLVRIETEIRRTFVLNEHFVSVFYDLEKAYDTTWRYGILLDLADARLKGRTPLYIKKFLENIQFNVKINLSFSNTYVQEPGVPQRGVLSVTLFALEGSVITKHIPNDNRFTASLYVDDLQIGYRHLDINTIQEKLQQSINNAQKWATETGFKFSTTETKAMHFTTKPGLHIDLDLTMYG